MKKKLFVFLVLSSCLFANEEDKKAASDLEMFLFKVGFESLLGDIKIVKEKSDLHRSEYTKNKTVLEEENKNSTNADISKFDNIISKLEKKVGQLEKKLEKKLEVKSDKKSINKITKTTEIAVKKSNSKNHLKAKLKNSYVRIQEKPSRNSKIIDTIYKGEVIFIESCNKFSWCKLKNKEAYAPGHLLVFIKD